MERASKRRPITAAEIEAGKSATNGGFTVERLRSWGVRWPPKAGWRERLLRKGVPVACPYPEGFVPVPCNAAPVPVNPLLAFSAAPPVSLPAGAIAIFTDGSCRRQAGGWGFAAYHGAEELHSECGGQGATTNNRMELCALIAALRWLDPEQAAIVWTDSQYAVRGILEWRHGWRKVDWRRANGTAMANADLWQGLFALIEARIVDVRWVRGHGQAAGNDRADALAALGRATSSAR